MKVNDIRSLAIAILLCCVSFGSAAQQYENSIFNKPLNIDATVKTERVSRSTQKGDTLVFNAAAYQVSENADSERLISKMPGVTVTDNGIEANGKEITRIFLDGQEFFGNDVLTALRNVPADLVKQIEIINKLSDNAQLTGIDDGEGYKAINIVTKRKPGQGLTTGRIYGSYGHSDMEDHKHNYIGGGNASYFSDKRSISVIGMTNNISQFNFTSSDILSGSTGLDAAGSGSFKVKALPGISSVHSLGVNYTDKKSNFSYFFNDITNSDRPTTDKYTFTSTDGQELYTQNKSDYEAHSLTHRLEGKITLFPESKHSMTIRPSFSFEDMYNLRNQYGRYSYVYSDGSDETFRKHQTNIYDNDRWTVRGTIVANYRYRPNKKKRRFITGYARYGYYQNSANDITQEYRWNQIDDDINDIQAADYNYNQLRDRVNRQHSGTFVVGYTEPIAKRATLAGEYTFQFSLNEGENLIYPLVDGQYATEPKERVSAINQSSFYHHRAGLRFNYWYKKLNITAIGTYEYTQFIGKTQLPSVGSTTRTYHSPLYTLVANLPFNKDNTLRIEARSRTQNPGNNMLQDIVDRSSTSNVKAGNPDINPAYLNNIEIQYINTNKKAGTTFSCSASYTGSHNYFCDSLVINQPDFVVMIDEKGKEVKLGKDNQFVKPINMSGYHKLMFKSNFSMPIDFLRCNFSLGTQASIQRLPGMINEEKVPINRNWFQLLGRLDSNISRQLDFTVYYIARYTMNDYSGKFGKVTNNFITHHLHSKLKWTFAKRFTFTGAFVFKNFKNTEGRYNDNFYFCDLFIGRKFLRNKKLEISVGVNDLFNNNVRSFNHNVSASGRTDGENIGIGRYFSAQAIWHFRTGTKPKKIIQHES
jgi:hypothetical protein